MRYIRLFFFTVSTWMLSSYAEYSFNDLYPAPSYYVQLQINEPNRQDTTWSILQTVATGAAIGTGTGLLARAIDSCWPGKLVYWCLTYTLRNAIVEAKLKRAYENGEKIDGNLLFNTAWISDWIAYLMTADISKSIKPSPPKSHRVYIHEHRVYRVPVD